ncbi:hypothetical protein [Streptomyces ehimensis]|uniref:Uncharacterized protein n=1 Tax=Streptomyces ehimensis TaxID=68195 RepID=A0ABV9BTL5_9ACTN
MEGLIAEAARRGTTDLSLASGDSRSLRAHHDAGMRIDEKIMEAPGESCRWQKWDRK